jgi:hypothetical protein
MEEDFPLHVYIDDTMDQKKVESVFRATDQWNWAVGNVVFVPMAYTLTADPLRNHGFITITEAELGKSGNGGSVHGDQIGFFYEGTSHRMMAQVRFDDDLQDSLLDEVMIHELGHALCLQHDKDDIRSIMYPYVGERSGHLFIMPDDIMRIRLMMAGFIYGPGTPPAIPVGVSIVPVQGSIPPPVMAPEEVPEPAPEPDAAVPDASVPDAEVVPDGSSLPP